MMDKREWMLRFVLENPFYEASSGDTIEAVGALYDAIVAASPQEPAWIEHRGEKPYPEGMVDVILRDGMERFNVDSDELIWDHDGDPGDIIAWRPA